MRLLADWRPDQIAGWLPDREIVARVMVGEQDPRITTEAAERVAEHLRAPLQRVPDGGHVLPEQVPDLVASEIAAVLDSAKSTKSTKPMVDGRD
jgi:pimeloyl-ACP methyl ester carboxylesterase